MFKWYKRGNLTYLKSRVISQLSRFHWPESLAARTGLLLITGLCLIQAAGLTIHALDRIDFDRLTKINVAQNYVTMVYRSIAETIPTHREEELTNISSPPGFDFSIDYSPNVRALFPTNTELLHNLRIHLERPPFPQRRLRPKQFMISHPAKSYDYYVAILLPNDNRWLNVHYTISPPNPFQSATFPIAFFVMTTAAGILTVWGVRRLIAPISTLSSAAEHLGKDVNSPPLPVTGPKEIVQASIAFNTMASRIRKFVNDRTLLLTAIGHDLRTPITRLKLRAEFIDDDELRDKFLNDLEELENMVDATLSFGCENNNQGPLVSFNLTTLIQTILDEAAESYPNKTDVIKLITSAHDITIKGPMLGLKRAFTNLIINAIIYGGNVDVSIFPPVSLYSGRKAKRMVQIWVEDNGPGLKKDDMERVLEPFVRLETSRNRETGGTGLGLAIASNIIRSHGGNISLSNRTPHGLKITVDLVV